MFVTLLTFESAEPWSNRNKNIGTTSALQLNYTHVIKSIFFRLINESMIILDNIGLLYINNYLMCSTQK